MEFDDGSRGEEKYPDEVDAPQLVDLSTRKNNLPLIYQRIKDRRSTWIKKKDHPDYKKTMSHFLMDPPFHHLGTLHIPDEELYSFYTYYARDWDMCMSLSFVECARRDCANNRLYYDLDFLIYNDDSERFYTAAEFEHVMEFMQSRVQAVFPHGSDMFVGTGGGVAHDRCGRRIWKMGFHVIWPDVYVCPQILQAVRKYLIDELNEQYPNATIPARFQDDSDIVLASPWFDVIDLNPAKFLSSRMFGSDKYVKCKCQKRAQCPHTERMINEGRSYGLIYVFDREAHNEEDRVRFYCSHKEVLLEHVSLRRTSDASECTLPDKYLAGAIDGPVNGAAGAAHNDGTGSNDGATNEAVDRTSSEYATLLGLMEVFYPADVHGIDRISTRNAGTSFHINVAGGTCFNNNNEPHSRSGIRITVRCC